MNRIHRLPDSIVAQIAAGEVVESPWGALKELIENAIDAGAQNIDIFLRNLGYDLISVRDDGCGIQSDELPLALESFATSKLDRWEDLLDMHSLGFRGEALGSMRSVARVQLASRAQEASHAWRVEGSPDGVGELRPGNLPKGTQVRVEDLFYNAPIRREFSGNARSLRKSLVDLVTNYAIGFHQIGFHLKIEDASVIDVPAKQGLTDRIEVLFSRNYRSGLLPVYWRENDKEISGYISNFDHYKTSGSHMRLYVNDRLIQYPRLVGLFRRAYGELMPPGRFPIVILFLHVPGNEVDVNVHPQKREIRFRDERKMQEFLYRAITHVIEGQGPIRMESLKSPGRSLSVVQSQPAENTVSSRLFEGSGAETTSTVHSQSSETDNKEELELNEKSDIEKRRHPAHQIEQAHARLFRTFVLGSSDEGLYLIDQHTAHERINYEKFLHKLQKQEDLSQQLVSPMALQLTPAEGELLKEVEEQLTTLGFQVEYLGPAGWSLHAIPFYLQPGEEEKALHKALQLLEHGEPIGAVRLFEQMAKDLSCRHSIRKGDDESLPNLQDLVDELSQCEHPGRCPHGRPTTVFLGREDIFSLFKRQPD